MHTRLDNNTNCIAIGEKMPLNEAILSIETFITTEFSYLEKLPNHLVMINQPEEKWPLLVLFSPLLLMVLYVSQDYLKKKALL